MAAAVATTSAEAAASTIIVDPDGDLSLVVGSDHQAIPTTFKVCSAAMRRASPVWKAMLFGGWAESKANNRTSDWVVSLPDDLPDQVLIILNIAHGKFDLVPDKFEKIHELYDLIVLADKYEAIQSLRLWVNSWIRHVGSVVSPTSTRVHRGQESPTILALLDATYIAWKLGHEPYFTSGMIQICLQLENSHEVHATFQIVDYITALEDLGMNLSSPSCCVRSNCQVCSAKPYRTLLIHLSFPSPSGLIRPKAHPSRAGLCLSRDRRKTR